MQVQSFRGDICPGVFADLCPAKDITWSNLTNGNARFHSKNYCWIIISYTIPNYISTNRPVSYSQLPLITMTTVSFLQG